MHYPRKRFGQNFLKDPYIINRIIDCIAPKPEQFLVEIGAGLGALTKPLLETAKKLHVIELDRDLISPLRIACLDLGELIIHETDVLKFDFNSLTHQANRLRLIGNLPYNISTQLIFHLLDYKTIIDDMHFMLQKEVVERMVAKPGNKTYGRLSVMVQYHCEVNFLFKVQAQAFHPPPKVESAIVRLKPYLEVPYPVQDYDKFTVIVREAFNHRRKIIHNALKDYVPISCYEKLGIDPQSRAEQLSVKDFVELTNALI